MKKIILFLLLLLPFTLKAQRTADQLPAGSGTQPISWWSLSIGDTTNRQIWAAFGGGKSAWMPTYDQMRSYVASHAPSTTITGGTILRLPQVGETYPAASPDVMWSNMYRPILPPTAALTGGNSYQYSNVGVTHNLSYSYGRQATTNTITTVVFNPGSINKFTTQPAQPGAVSGTQSVTTAANTNTTYSLTVTATGGLSAFVQTSDNWYPFYYVGTCAGTTPTSAEVLAATTKGFGTGTAYNMNFTFTGTNLHVFYAYYSAYATVTSVKDAAGNQAIGAMTLNTVNITDNGFNGNWKTVTTNNTYSNANIVLFIL